ncbi:MAG: hypothetical protein LBR79_07145 [Oscillospiraceae bacterium]|jgi:hypothetical protein|nr:hypothetical protein [Oscillospiraceae bacterium]
MNVLFSSKTAIRKNKKCHCFEKFLLYTQSMIYRKMDNIRGKDIMKNSNNKCEGFLTYKGKPLVKSGDVIYYGNLSDKYIVKISIKEFANSESDNMKIATDVDVQLMNISGGINEEKVTKTSSKNNLYLALDIADIWLERALS